MLTLTTGAKALNVTASSCSRSDVASAIATVEAGGGGTVDVPSGDCNWDGGSYNGLAVSGNVSFIGAGVGQTIIRVTDGSQLFSWNEGATSSTFVEFSGFTVYSDLGCTSSCRPANLMKIYKTQNFKISNNHFEGYFYSPILWKSVSKGLIDNNTFINHNVAKSGSYYGPTAGEPYDGSGHPQGTSNENCDATICECSAGEYSIDRASYVATGNTVISGGVAVIDNSGGSGKGKVQRIYLNLATATEGATVNLASFSRSGNVFTARDKTTNLPVKAGMNVFTADSYTNNPFTTYTAFNIYNGDYIGVYLNGATVEAASGSTGWVESGDQTDKSSVNFDSPAIGAVSLWVEIYDVEDDLKDCEQAWIDWYTDDDTRSAHFQGYERGWAYDDNAIYFEDNTFTWYKSFIAGNWGGGARFVIRHNTFYTENGNVILFTKPGNNYLIVHDNLFEWIGANGSQGYTTWINTDGLYYNNTIKNIKYAGSWEAYRSYSDFSFPFYVRPKEIYIWNNTYTNANCGSTDSDCWYSANQGAYWMNQPGENGSIHFRAPKSGERLYNFTEYTYPHPLTLGDYTPPGSPTRFRTVASSSEPG